MTKFTPFLVTAILVAQLSSSVVGPPPNPVDFANSPINMKEPVSMLVVYGTPEQLQQLLLANSGQIKVISPDKGRESVSREQVDPDDSEDSDDPFTCAQPCQTTINPICITDGFEKESILNKCVWRKSERCCGRFIGWRIFSHGPCPGVAPLSDAPCTRRAFWKH